MRVVHNHDREKVSIYTETVSWTKVILIWEPNTHTDLQGVSHTYVFKIFHGVPLCEFLLHGVKKNNMISWYKIELNKNSNLQPLATKYQNQNLKIQINGGKYIGKISV